MGRAEHRGVAIMLDQAKMQSQQRVLADFGEFALRSEDLDEVRKEACRLISDALGTKYAKVMEIDHDTNEVVAVTGIGWPEDIVGRVRLPLTGRSSEAYAIEQGKPVVSPDIREEDRFDFPDFLVEAGVVSLVNVPIFLPGGIPYGLLQVDDRKKRAFTSEDIEFLRTYSMILGPVIDRLHKSHDLRAALRERDALMQELQHRVKNNFAMIGSLLRLRERQTSSPETKEELLLVAARIDVLRSAHDHLHFAHEQREVRLGPYLQEIMSSLLELNDAEAQGIRCQVEAGDVWLTSHRAVPLGLIVNEFATNSIKHAFGGQGGTITLELETLSPNLRLTVADDGRGRLQLGEPQQDSGTGVHLIETLAQQLEATLHWPEVDRGTKLIVELKQ